MKRMKTKIRKMKKRRSHIAEQLSGPQTSRALSRDERALLFLLTAQFQQVFEDMPRFVLTLSFGELQAISVALDRAAGNPVAIRRHVARAVARERVETWRRNVFSPLAAREAQLVVNVTCGHH